MLTAAVVVAGGEPVDDSVREEIPEPAWVVAADSGLDQALRLGWRVDLVVGDLDSATPAALTAYSGVPLQRHDPDKDATDLELALRAVAEHPDMERVVVVGGDGGRLDHLLANAAVLASPEFAHLQVEWVAGAARCHVVHQVARLHGHPGETVSLLAVGGPALGVTTQGMRWALHDEDLAPWSSRGVSNQFVSSVATVSVRAGTLLAVQPEAVPGD